MEYINRTYIDIISISDDDYLDAVRLETEPYEVSDSELNRILSNAREDYNTGVYLEVYEIIDGDDDEVKHCYTYYPEEIN